MKKLFVIIGLTLCFFAYSSAANNPGSRISANMMRLEKIVPGSYVQGDVIIKLRAERPAVLQKGKSGFASLDAVLSTLVAPRLEPLFKGHTDPPADPSTVDLSRYYVVHYGGPGDAIAVAKILLRSADVEFAEPRFRYMHQFVPNDPSFSNQWHLPKINADQAWDITQGDSTVVIAIVDSGIRRDHDDLLANIWTNPGETGLDTQGNDKRFNGIDDDGDGYVDDWFGWDFYHTATKPEDNDPNPGSPHGTHVGGIAAAVTNNGIGIAGVAPHCRLMAVKVGPDDPSLNTIDFGYEGIVYAADRGAKIINCSWAGPGFSQMGQDVIIYAIQHGALVIAAAGNGGTDNTGDGESIDNVGEYPASYPEVMAVGSTNTIDAKSTFSNYGYKVAVSAPGESILSTLPIDTYGYLSGTSMATPVVCGVAALVKSLHPEFTPRQLEQQVRVTADNIDGGNQNYLHQIGFGRVNAYKALTMQSPAIQLTRYVLSDSGTGNNDGYFDAGESLSLRAVLTNFLQPSGAVTLTLTSLDQYSTVQNSSQTMRALGTLDSAETIPFIVQLSPSTPQNQRVKCLLQISSGAYNDYGFITFLVRPTFEDMNANQITMTVTSKGNLGYNDYPDNLQGSGFLYRKTGNANYLFEGALLLGTDSSHIVDAARGNDYNFQDADFSALNNFALLKQSTIADQEGRTLFNDGTAGANKLGVLVDCAAYAFTDTTDQNFVLLRYKLTNTSGAALSNFHAGVFLDWDIGSVTNNIAGVDTAFRLGYAVDSAAGGNSAYAGIVALGTDPLMFHAINNADTGSPWGIYDGFSKSEKWDALSGGVTATKAGPGDISMVIGMAHGIFTPADTIVFPFAFIAADNLDALKSAARQAAIKWNGIKNFDSIHSQPPPVFSLDQNYPNPFNNGTTIKFSIEQQGPATLIVYDILGRRIETLVDGMLQAGPHEAVFPKSRSVASGIYFYRLNSGGRSLVRKMVTIR